MKFFAVAAALATVIFTAAWTCPAIAEDAEPPRCVDLARDGANAVVQIGQEVMPDYIVLSRSPQPQYAANVCYYNSFMLSSASVTRELILPGTQFSVTVELIVGQESETIRVTPPPGYIVFPAEDAEQLVPDGEQVTIQIMGAMS